MRIVFAGTPEFAVPSLRALVSAGHDVVGVLTREDAPVGRKRVLTPSPVAAAATELGIPLHRANRLDSEASEWVRELAPDLGVIVAYGGLVREPLLSTPHHGWINLHFSELPRWRGAAPVQRALMAGERRLGVTVFRLVADLDAGAVLSRGSKEYAVGLDAGQVLTDLAEFGTSALAEAIRHLTENPEAGEPQQGEVSYAHKLTREDGRIDLRGSEAQVLAHWAGVTPEPGAWVLFDGQPLKMIELAPTTAAAEPLSVASGHAMLVGGRALVGVGAGALELCRVQPPGKKVMSGADWLRGRSEAVEFE